MNRNSISTLFFMCWMPCAFLTINLIIFFFLFIAGKVPMQWQSWQMSLLMYGKWVKKKNYNNSNNNFRLLVWKIGERVVATAAPPTILTKKKSVNCAKRQTLLRSLTELIWTTFECIEASNRDLIVADMWFLFAMNKASACVCVYT